MGDAFRRLCERWLRIPPDPKPPPGDEASTRLFRAAPNFYKYLLVLWALHSVLAIGFVTWISIGPIIGMVVMVKKGQSAGWLLLLIPGLFLLLVAALRLFALGILRLDYEKRWYIVTDRSLRVREGIVTVREMTVTFANIQNISISQGPIQRLLGIADLRVDTAGGATMRSGKQPGQGMHTAWFRGVDNVNEVRELIQQRLRLWKDSGLGDHEERLKPSTGLHAPGSTGPSPVVPPGFLEALREVSAEATALRRALGP
jgi:membrane protein YdbS with pleckstrin-like domain